MKWGIDHDGGFLRDWQPYFTLVLLGCLFYLPGFTQLPPTDRDEARFAQASRQMLETGNYIDIRFQGRPRYKKPIGIYWLQALSAGIIEGPESSKIWPYRVPSMVGGLIAVLLTFYLGKTFFSRKAGFFAALLLESSFLLQVETRLATTDAALLATITAMMGLLGRLYLTRGDEHSWTTVAGFWGVCGIGVLLKGPIPPLVALLAVGFLVFSEKSWGIVRRLHPGWGILLLLLVVSPWFIAVQGVTQGRFIRKAFFTDLLPKLIGGHESHGAPPGFYTVLFPFMYGPGTLFLLGALRKGWVCRKERKGLLFLIAWILPTWLVFEMIPTKLPHYILPVFPAISLLIGYFIAEAEQGGEEVKRNHARSLPGRFSKGVFALSMFSVGAGVVAMDFYFRRTMSLSSLVVGASTGVVIWLAFTIKKRRLTTTVVVICLASALGIVAPAFQSILPGSDALWLSREVAKVVPAAGRHRLVLASVGYYEPSLVFLLGTRTKLVSPREAVELIERNAVTYLLVSEKKRRFLLKEAEKRGISLRPLRVIRGFNYSKGKWMTLTLFVVGGTAPETGT